jgi:predicted RNA-binding Zn-ribbon protein involved in translation (DUF1610 family)
VIPAGIHNRVMPSSNNNPNQCPKCGSEHLYRSDPVSNSTGTEWITDTECQHCGACWVDKYISQGRGDVTIISQKKQWANPANR